MKRLYCFIFSLILLNFICQLDFLALAQMALEMQDAIAYFERSAGEAFQLRIGINTGVAVAGVIGTSKFSYDLWGDALSPL